MENQKRKNLEIEINNLNNELNSERKKSGTLINGLSGTKKMINIGALTELIVIGLSILTAQFIEPVINLAISGVLAISLAVPTIVVPFIDYLYYKKEIVANEDNIDELEYILDEKKEEQQKLNKKLENKEEKVEVQENKNESLNTDELDALNEMFKPVDEEKPKQLGLSR